MKILMVTSAPLFPTHEGNRARVLSLTRALRAQGHELWVVVIPGNGPMPCDIAAHEAELTSGKFMMLGNDRALDRLAATVRHLPFRLRRKIRNLTGAGIGFHTGLDEFYNKRWNAILRRLHEAHNFDAIIVEYVFNSRALEALPDSVLKLIDTHDAFADRHIQYVEKGMPNDYWISLTPHDENRGFRRAHVLVAIQGSERQRFASQLGAGPSAPVIGVVSHFIDADFAPVSDFAPRNALFLASGNPSNTASIRFFIDKVLPLVLRSVPDFRLFLAGSICRIEDDHPAIVRLGRVERPVDAFRQAPLLVNPMLLGTGINIKLLDAFAAGVPTVSTETGSRGLEARFCAGVVTVPDDDAAGFARHVVALLQDPARRSALGLAARAAALAWNAEQNAALAGLLAQHPGASVR